MKPEKRKLIEDLVALKHRAGVLGWWRTMHALEHAIREVGWDAAEEIDPEQRKLADKYKEARRT